MGLKLGSPWHLLAGSTAVVFLIAVTALLRAEPAPLPEFDKVIAPLLAKRCLECHAGAAPKGGLDLTTRAGALKQRKRGQAVVPGKPAESLLWDHVSEGSMPPKKPLPEAEKKLLHQWLAAGAPWSVEPIDPYRWTTELRAGYDWWSLQPLQRPTPPAIRNPQSAIRNPLDRFILVTLEAKGLEPSPPADRRTLIRRLTFDLLGLPPTPAEVAAFVADSAPDACEKLVDRLLASPHYGERWARHWLDVARFGESHGFEHDELRRNAWPYRDWVIQALNRDMPYDQFARWQLAGDVLKPGDPEASIATGFLVAGGYDSVGQGQLSTAMRAIVRQDELEDIVATVGQTFLGLTVHCARCHDHKFDPVRQSEYYRLTAALAGVRHGERDVTSGLAQQMYEQQRVQREKRRQQLAAELATLERPARTMIQAQRKEGETPVRGPEPLAQWDFTQGLRDRAGKLDASQHGFAMQQAAGLVVNGTTAYAATVPLTRNIKARTLTGLVRLQGLQQRGGAVISLQTLGGEVFDAIVFGEREPGRWMAGSEAFHRTQSFGGPAETEADQKPVHIAIVYAEDGSITCYRNGALYGKPYTARGPQEFAAGKAQLVFGLRHSPAQAGKMLAGVILQAQVFERALNAAEVAASAGVASNYASDEEIARFLSPTERQLRQQILYELAQLQSLPPLTKRLTYTVVPRAPEIAHLLQRGNPAQPGQVVTPGGVAAVAGSSADFGLLANASDAERRVRLAAWLTDARNPLFARTIVNRLWHYHFGVGLVDTPNDLGFNGGKPSHPELLDWLATELIRQGWSLKAMHKLLVTSATYRQASRYRADAVRVDAGNRLLWRKHPMRLEAEAVRDSMLHISGQLNLKMGGPGYQDFKVTIRGNTYYYPPIEEEDAAVLRRSVYRTWARSGRHRLLDAFDCPDPSTAAPSRAVTTTPLQALTLLNNGFVLRMAERFAERIQDEAGKEADAQIAHAYLLAYGRQPTAEEMAPIRAVVAEHGLSALCRAILNSNEFIYID